MPKQNNFVTREYFDEKFGQVEKKLKKLDWILEKLDWLIGKHRDHEEEHTLISGKLSEHSDRLEKVEDKLGITV